MSKRVIILLITLITFVTTTKSAFAATDGDGNDNSPFSSNFVSFNEQLGTKLNTLTSPGSIISNLLPYLLTIAGLVLFAMLITGGFEIMTATTDAKKAEAGKGRITTAIIGFIIIFAAYWIAQIVEIIFGVSIVK